MKTDLIIIGAGPVGLYAAFYAGLRGMNAIVLDALENTGGQLTTLYPEKFIYDIPGQLKIRAKDLIDVLQNQAEQFSDLISFNLGEEVLEVNKIDEREFKVITKKQTYEAKAILVAAGGGAFTPRKLGLEHEDKFNNIKYFIQNMDVLKGKNVVIFGGGDSAVDWAMMLHEEANVTVVHRRDDFRAKEATVEEMKNSNVNVFTPYVPINLIGDGDKLTQIELEHVDTKETKTIDVDYAIVNFGFSSTIGQIKEWDLDLENGLIAVDSHQKTSLDGVYAVGNICDYPGKIKLITVGLGEVPIAMNEIKMYINPNSKNVIQYSSNFIKNN